MQRLGHVTRALKAISINTKDLVFNNFFLRVCIAVDNIMIMLSLRFMVKSYPVNKGLLSETRVKHLSICERSKNPYLLFIFNVLPLH
jgi:hypothetical protein